MKLRKARVHKGPLEYCHDPICVARAGKPPARPPVEERKPRYAGAAALRVGSDPLRMRRSTIAVAAAAGSAVNEAKQEQS